MKFVILFFIIIVSFCYHLSHITNKKKIVMIKHFSSDSFNIPLGFPQGPYVIYLKLIYDLHFSKSRKLLFADDMKFV